MSDQVLRAEINIGYEELTGHVVTQDSTLHRAHPSFAAVPVRPPCRSGGPPACTHGAAAPWATGRSALALAAWLPEERLRRRPGALAYSRRADSPHPGPLRLNLMTAHEHFMHRLGILDGALPRFLRRLEPLLRADSALFLLADHGTHGIWYNHFAVGQAEHRAPTLWLLLPASFVEAHPSVDGALRRNRKRRVTPYDLHATLRHLAAWPAMPEPTAEASSLFVDLPEARSCVAARVPAEWCIDQPEDCFE